MAMKLYLTRGNLIQMKLRIFFFIYSKQQQQQQTFYSQIHLKPTKKRKEKKEISFFCVYCVK